MSEGDCPINGCASTPRRGHLMCGKHWALVPFKMKDEVWRTYRAGTTYRDYREARKAAIDAVHEKLAAKAGT